MIVEFYHNRMIVRKGYKAIAEYSQADLLHIIDCNDYIIVNIGKHELVFYGERLTYNLLHAWNDGKMLPFDNFVRVTKF